MLRKPTLGVHGGPGMEAPLENRNESDTGTPAGSHVPTEDLDD